jgi:tetratricopeptide (TPR) repeat protein
MLVPVMGLTDTYFMKYSLVADHYAHLAMIGVLAVAAAGWAQLRAQASPALPRRGAAGQRDSAAGTEGRRIPASLKLWAPHIAAAAVVGCLGCLTWRQSGIYRDARTLYEATLEKNPGCWLAHNNLGNAWSQLPGRLNDAIAQYEEALRLRPDYAPGWHNLGVSRFNLGNMPAAAAAFREELRLSPNDPAARQALAAALQQAKGR